MPETWNQRSDNRLRLGAGNVSSAKPLCLVFLHARRNGLEAALSICIEIFPSNDVSLYLIEDLSIHVKAKESELPSIMQDKYTLVLCNLDMPDTCALGFDCTVDNSSTCSQVAIS